MSVTSARIIVWDVGHGSSVSILAPDGRTAMLDLGANVGTEFSPVKFTKMIWNIKDLDRVIVSHPHLDHIRDIVNLHLCPPKVFFGLNISREELITPETREEDRPFFDAYLDFKSRYKYPISPEDDSNTDSWGNPGYLKTYSIEADWNKEPNNTSIVTFFRMEKFTLLYPGDIESRGWDEMLKLPGFVDDLKSTQFFVASHHGREAGFSQDILKKAQPQLVIISDSSFKDTSVTGRYSNQASGFQVVDENNNVTEKRNVVSTRNDGRVIIDVYQDGTKTSASVKVKLSS